MNIKNAGDLKCNQPRFNCINCGGHRSNKWGILEFFSDNSYLPFISVYTSKETYLYNLRLASPTRGEYGTFTVVDHWKGHGHSFRRRFWGITDGSNYILSYLLLKTLTRCTTLHVHLILVQLHLIYLIYR